MDLHKRVGLGRISRCIIILVVVSLLTWALSQLIFPIGHEDIQLIVKRLLVEDLFADPVLVKLPPGVIESYRKLDIGKEEKAAGLF